jgi:hypothetical protein
LTIASRVRRHADSHALRFDGRLEGWRWIARLAEREGFEPSIPCGIPHFQCGALGH